MNYNYPVLFSYTPQDNQTEIAKGQITFKDCSFFPSSDDGLGFWNCNHCPNDDNYCQPYIDGDLIYFQLAFNRETYCNYNDFELYIVVNGVKIQRTNGLTNQVGVGEDGTGYINVVIDTGQNFFNDKTCWYLQIELENCITQTLDLFNTEFYCLTRCEEPTLLFTGLYPSGTDCNGNYYGLISGVTNIYFPSFRVRGVVEAGPGYEFEETKNNNIKIKSKQIEQFTLFTKKVPYYVARQIAACINSKQLTIDGVDYSGPSKLSKNFDEGLMWIIKETLTIECDEKNFTCS